MPQLSIIVPIYNVEKYLPKCLDSILAQTFRDFELLLIDDGSPDQCGRICDEYAARDARIRVIHKPNGGVSSARNAGLDIATGEYIGFVDPDDWCDKKMYEIMLKAAVDTGAEIVSCNFATCNSIKDVIVRNTQTISGKYKFYSPEELLIARFNCPPVIDGGVCNKVFKKTLLKDVYFDEILSIGEDTLFFLQAGKLCNKLATIEEILYFVYERPGSATRKEKTQLLRWLKAMKKCVNLVSDCGKTVRLKAFAKLFDLCLTCMSELPDYRLELWRNMAREIWHASYLPPPLG